MAARAKARPDPPLITDGPGLDHATGFKAGRMSTLPYITFVVGPVDVALTIVVGGTVVLAIVLNILGLLSWLRRRP